MNIFSFRLVRQDEWDAKDSERKQLADANLRLRAENTALKNSTEPQRPFVPVEVSDGEPTDSTERKMYVAKVAGFHQEILKPKVLRMISDARAELEKWGNSDPTTTALLRGTINALWLFYDWGELMTNEQISNQTQIDGEELNELKELIK
jgi:hypothetical protein